MQIQNKKGIFDVKYKVNYGNHVGVFPKSVFDVISRAGGVELKVLLGICSSEGSVDTKKLAKLISCAESDVKDAISFWRGAGIIEPCDDKEAKSEAVSVEVQEKPSKAKPEGKSAVTEVKSEEKKLKSANELPKYSSEELADILETRENIVSLINECQNIIGKVFNLKEISVIIGLIDYLGLDPEYILILLTYCVSIDKKSLHYVETTAFSLYDAGITEAGQLTEEIRRRELAASSEGQIRKIFGIGARAFTSKEKKFIYTWLNDMRYTVEIVTKAYEVSANATGKASFPYTNAVLERWNSENLRTIEEIEAAERQKEQGNAQGAAEQNGSFDTDDFFAAAVRRSLGG